LLRRGAGEGKAPPPAFEWANLGIYPLSEMKGTLFDTDARIFCEEKGLQTQPPRLRGSYFAWVVHPACLTAA
jgi:hypothetical protein